MNLFRSRTLIAYTFFGALQDFNLNLLPCYPLPTVVNIQAPSMLHHYSRRMRRIESNLNQLENPPLQVRLQCGGTTTNWWGRGSPPQHCSRSSSDIPTSQLRQVTHHEVLSMLYSILLIHHGILNESDCSLSFEKMKVGISRCLPVSAAHDQIVHCREQRRAIRFAMHLLLS